MKNRFLCLALFTSLVLITSCDADPCDDGYSQIERNGASFCLPDYVVGIELGPEFGNTFYHKAFGMITFENDIWSNENGEVLTVSQLNTRD